MPQTRTAARFILAAFFLIALEAPAANFGVAPTFLELGPQKSTDALTVTNEGEQPVVLQAGSFIWSQEAGKDIQAPTSDLIVTPPIFTVGPHQKQIVRVGLRKQPHPGRETSYRLELEEVPDRTEAAGNTLRIVVKMSLPVFFRPPGLAPVLRWEVERLAPSSLRVDIRNDGSAHEKVSRIELLSARDGAPLVQEDTVIYVLPGNTKQVTFKTAAPVSVDELRIIAFTNAGRVEANAVLKKP